MSAITESELIKKTADQLSSRAFPQNLMIGKSELFAMGMSKRELFAAMAFQGFCTKDPNEGVMICNRRNVAELAVAAADALIAELEKEHG